MAGGRDHLVALKTWVARDMIRLTMVERLGRASSMLGRPSSFSGGLAQLGERLHGMQEVRGSSPLSSIIVGDRFALASK